MKKTLSKKGFLATAIIGTLLNATSVAASTIDWNNLIQTGSFPSYSFSDSTLGLVNLSYSSGSTVSGVSSDRHGVGTLLLGNSSGQSLTMSWSNSVNELSMQIWDIDAMPGKSNETVTFTTTASVSPVFLHSTDIWDSATQTLGNDGTLNINDSSDNFSLIHFANSGGFNSITFDWSVAGIGSGSMGIGDILVVEPDAQVVPLPSAIYLFGAGIIGLFRFANQKKA